MATVYPQAVLSKDDGTTYDLSALLTSSDGLEALTTSLVALSSIRTVQIVPTCNADAHTAGDVIADSEILAAITPGNDIIGEVRSVSLLRLDSTTGIDVRVWFLKANVALGTESGVVLLTDGNAVHLLGYVDFVASDFVSYVQGCFAQVTPARKVPLVPVAASDDVYIAIEARGAVDLAAATDLVLTVYAI